MRSTNFDRSSPPAHRDFSDLAEPALRFHPRRGLSSLGTHSTASSVPAGPPSALARLRFPLGSPFAVLRTRLVEDLRHLEAWPGQRSWMARPSGACAPRGQPTNSSTLARQDQRRAKDSIHQALSDCVSTRTPTPMVDETAIFFR